MPKDAGRRHVRGRGNVVGRYNHRVWAVGSRALGQDSGRAVRKGITSTTLAAWTHFGFLAVAPALTLGGPNVLRFGKTESFGMGIR